MRPGSETPQLHDDAHTPLPEPVRQAPTDRRSVAAEVEGDIVRSIGNPQASAEIDVLERKPASLSTPAATSIR